MKRRRLSDLYAMGRKALIDDGHGAVEVWLQKLSPIEMENALRRSSVERAKMLVAAKDEESELWQAAWADLHEWAPTKEQLLQIALADKIVRFRAKIEAELADDEEWSKDDYLQGLVDAWDGTGAVVAEPPAEDAEEPSESSVEGERDPLRFAYARGEEDPRFPEALRVKNEIDRFSNRVEELVAAERANLLRDYEDEPIDKIRRMAVERTLEQQSSNVMFEEYENQELFYAVRDPETKKRYFGSRDEVVGLQPEVRARLIAEYRALMVDPAEGKGSPGTPGSSQSSDSSGQAATQNSSGPVAVPA